MPHAAQAPLTALLALLTLFGAMLLPLEARAQQAPRCNDSPVIEKLRADRDAYLDTLRAQPALRKPVADPPAVSSLVILSAPPNPLVQDELLYHVAADRNSGAVYVIRSGGYGGLWEVLGPVATMAERPLCTAVPSSADVAAPKAS